MAVQLLRTRLKETVAGAILDAAEQLAAQVGLPAASLQGIAQRAGVAVGTIYNYFSDRNELFAEVFARRRAELLTTLDGADRAVARGTFDAQLGSFVRTVLTYFDDRRAFLRIALEGGVAKPHVSRSGEGGRGSMEQLRARAERIVRTGVKEGRLRADGADLCGPFLVAALRAVLVARIGAAAPLSDETERVISLFLRGSGAP